MNAAVKPFEVVSPAKLPLRDERRRWLVEGLWPSAAVGIVGGQPKCGKTWFALDMAISVASGTPCLGSFRTTSPGPVLVYAAEDNLADIRARIQGISKAKGVALSSLDLGVIVTDKMRLDSESDRARLRATLESFCPVLVVLDPFVRLHSAIDENSSAAVSTILGELRSLQRKFDTAIALVHHARKNSNGCRPGQALRGSSDFHAWGDVTLFLSKKELSIFRLAIEHRTAASPGTFELELTEQMQGVSLKLLSELGLQKTNKNDKESLKARILATLRLSQGPISQRKVREQVKARNQKVGEILQSLKQEGLVENTGSGWGIVEQQMKLGFPSA